MKEDITFHPKYEKYFDRITSNHALFATLIIIVFSNFAITLVYILHRMGFYIYFLNIIPLIAITRFLLSYRYYLGYIKLQYKEKSIEYSIFSFNNKIKVGKINLSESEVKICEIEGMRHNTYCLRIHNFDECLISQKETNEWTIEIFKEIVEKINLIKTMQLPPK